MKLTESKLIELILEQKQAIRDRGRSTPGSSFSNWLAENPPKDWNVTNYTESFMRKMGQFYTDSSNETKTLTLGAVGWALIEAGKKFGWGNALQLLFTPMMLKIDGTDRAEELERKINSRGLDGYADWLKENWDFILYYLPKTWMVMLTRDLGNMFLQQYNMDFKSLGQVAAKVFSLPTGLGTGSGKRKISDMIQDQYLENYPWKKLALNGVYPTSQGKFINSIKKLNKLGWELPLDPDGIETLSKILTVIELRAIEKNTKKVQDKILKLINGINSYFSERYDNDELSLADDQRMLFFKLYVSEPEKAAVSLTEYFILKMIKFQLGYVTSYTKSIDEKYRQNIENWKKQFLRIEQLDLGGRPRIYSIDLSKKTEESEYANKIIPVIIKKIRDSDLKIDIPRKPNTGMLPGPQKRYYGKSKIEKQKQDSEKRRKERMKKMADIGR